MHASRFPRSVHGVCSRRNYRTTLRTNRRKIRLPCVCRRPEPARVACLEQAEAHMDIEWQDALLRLGAATVAGIAIGINRDLSHKPIGMRTLALVALGAATVSVAAIQFSFLD